MNRPPDVTPEDLARWYRQAEISGPPNTTALKKLFPKFQESDYRERWAAAEWLYRHLDELGCDDQLAGRICFANGQIAYHFEDPWQVAQKAVDDFRVGKWEVPGPELAARLFHEHYPEMLRKFGPPDQKALREMLADPELRKPIPHPFPHDPV